MLQFQNKCGLMCFSYSRDGKWMPEFEVVRSVINFHRLNEAQFSMFCQLHCFYSHNNYGTVRRVGSYSSLTCTPLLLLNKLKHTHFLQDRSYFMRLLSSYQNFI